jgi:hypothetical protein
VGDAGALEAESGEFDLGICVGSTHAFGMGDAAFPNTIARMRQFVRAGGYVLIGEAYWKQEPAAEYLKLIGQPVGIYRDHIGNIAFARERGLEPVYDVVSDLDEWDDFEQRHFANVQSDAEAKPDDPKLAAKLAASGRWREGYLRWGRSTMGFGLYLFRVAGELTDGEIQAEVDTVRRQRREGRQRAAGG